MPSYVSTREFQSHQAQRVDSSDFWSTKLDAEFDNEVENEMLCMEVLPEWAGTSYEVMKKEAEERVLYDWRKRKEYGGFDEAFYEDED